LVFPSFALLNNPCDGREFISQTGGTHLISMRYPRANTASAPSLQIPAREPKPVSPLSPVFLERLGSAPYEAEPLLFVFIDRPGGREFRQHLSKTQKAPGV
jgi:hypothetical protein